MLKIMAETQSTDAPDSITHQMSEEEQRECKEEWKWATRRLRLVGRRFGALKEAEEPSVPLRNVSVTTDDLGDEVDYSPNKDIEAFAEGVFQFFIGEKPFSLLQLRRISWKECKLWPPKIKIKEEPQSVIDGRIHLSGERTYGMGIVGELSRRKLKPSAINSPRIKEQMENLWDFRPYFTYWVCFVQVTVMFLALCIYGIGPLGFGLSHQSSLVLTEWLTMEQVDIFIPSNVWIGPDLSDLVKIGALFTPCMRPMTSIQKRRVEQAHLESNHTGCCVRNDGSGCVQTVESSCSPFLSTFHKWNTNNPGPDGRTSGPVCDLDPQYCSSPVSNGPHTWPDDASNWPICWKSKSLKEKIGAPRHMTCTVVAKPCCVGIHGQCELRSEDYCDWVGGTFHPEASLCSQVSCMGDVCGMIPFNETPNQFYRLFTSLFINAGLVQLVVVLAFQLLIMRDIEKLCGSGRVASIFLVSGMIGNLVSAMFTPFRPECGPSGALFGIMGALVAEVVKAWPLLKNPTKALWQILLPVGIFILIGFLPWVDNYAHISGFAIGLCLSYALLPHVHTSAEDKYFNQILKWLLFALVVFTSLGLLLLFYLVELSECDICKLLSCIPFTRDFCAEMNINFERRQRLF